MKKCETISGERNITSSSLKDELFGILKSIAESESDIFRKHEPLFGNTGLHTAVQFKMYDFLLEIIELDLRYPEDFDRVNKAGKSVQALLKRESDHKEVSKISNKSLRLLLQKLEASDLKENAKGYKIRLKIPLHTAIGEKNLQRLYWLTILGGYWSSKNANGLSAAEYFATTFDDSKLNFLQKKWFMAAADQNNETLLHIAVRLNLSNLFNFLIENGVCVNSRRHDSGMTPLHFAAKFNRHEFSETLLHQRKADVDALDFDLQTPLHIAAEYNSVEVAEICIKYGANVDAKRDYGKTPLHIASFRNSLSCLKTLIAHHADVNLTDDSSNTPLMECSEEGNFDCAVQLIENGANVHAKNAIGLKAIDFAARYNHNNILELFIDDIHTINNNGETLLFEALFGRSIESLTFLIKNGVDCNRAAGYGTTPLHRAAYLGFTEGAALLVENKAKINERDCNNDTPLHIAIDRNKNTELAEGLMKHGADVNALNDKNLTPLILAIRKNQSEIVGKMTLSGANLELLKENGQTPLNVAIFYGSLNCLRILIENGANINLKCFSGKTPLHFASAMAKPDCLKLLIGANADVMAADDDGLTALDMVGKLVKNLAKEEKNICIQILKDAIAAAT